MRLYQSHLILPFQSREMAIMMMNDPTEGLIYKILDWISTVTILNFFWILLTLLGGIIFGWAPATVAVMAVWRLRMRGHQDAPVVKTLWKEYRANFLPANGVGIVVVLAGASLIFYSFTLSQWEGIFMAIFWMLFVFITVIYLIVLTFIFPVYIHYKIGFREYFKYAFAIGISHLHYVIMIVSATVVIFWASGFFPAIYVLFTFSLIFMFITRLSLIVFDKIEDRQRDGANEEHIKTAKNKQRSNRLERKKCK